MAFVTVSVRLNPEQVKHLKKLSHQISIARDSNVSHNDLIREAIESQFPMPADVKDGKPETHE